MNARDLALSGQQNALRPRVLGHSRVRWTTRAQHAADEHQDARRCVMRELLVVRRKDHRVTRGTLVVDPRDHRAIRLDRCAQIDDVQLTAAIDWPADEMRERAMVPHTVRGVRKRCIAKPAQISGVWLEQASRAEHQRRLASSGRTDDRDGLSHANLEVNAAEHLSGGETRTGANTEALAKRTRFEGERHADR